jgi:hypothetical protein
MQINFGGSPTNPIQATTYQIVTPWGQTSLCTTLEEALTQAFQRHSRFTGKMGTYFASGTTNGLSTTVSGTMSANDIISTDYN